MVAAKLSPAVGAVRAFNRFYTRRLGLLNTGLLGSPYSLTEVRVMFEIARRPGITASDIIRELGLDRGYLSRLLQRFASRKLIARTAAKADARQVHLRLTARGVAVFGELDAKASQEVSASMAHLPAFEQQRLAGLMRSAHRLLETPPEATVRLRALEPGDLGWVVARHGALYAAEYKWDATFEGLVAKIVGDFACRPDPARERGWIATLEGEPVGCVFLVRRTATTAQLRLLLVEPTARGHGIGRQLVAACVDFARAAGYKKVRLWTNSVLHAARRIYETAGFRLVASDKHHSFGHDLVGQTWELRLTG